jgi:MYXO-CTERM domain-containing protein
VDDPSQCTHSEYGSQLSFMGSGPMHVSGYHKVAQGWLSGCNGVTVGGSGTYTLVPTEIPCDGVQILQVPAPKTRSAPMAGDRQGRAPMLTHYYLELRTPRSFDARYEDPQVFISIGPDYELRNSAPYVYQLNRTPDNNNNRPSLADGGYTTGDTFEDPAGGLTFTFDSVTNDQATITISGPPAGGGDTCLDDMAFTAPGPGPESCGLPIPPTGGAGGGAGMGGAGAPSAAGASAGGAAGAAAAGAAGQPPGAGGSSGGMGGVAGATTMAGTGGMSAGSAGAATAGAPTGAGGAAGQATGAAGMLPSTAGQASVSAEVPPPEEPVGCGCRVAGERRDGSARLLALAGVLSAIARRRRTSAKAR